MFHVGSCILSKLLNNFMAHRRKDLEITIIRYIVGKMLLLNPEHPSNGYSYGRPRLLSNRFKTFAQSVVSGILEVGRRDRRSGGRRANRDRACGMTEAVTRWVFPNTSTITRVLRDSRRRLSVYPLQLRKPYFALAKL